MGQNSTSNGDGSVAIGGMGQAYDEYNTPIYDENGDPVLIGTQAVVGYTAIDAGAQATGEVSTAVGNGDQALGGNSFAGGHKSRATGDYRVAIGQAARARGYLSTAVGGLAWAKWAWPATGQRGGISPKRGIRSCVVPRRWGVTP